MAGKRKANEAGSTNDLRGDVLRVLGVLKVATADQIQRLSSPHLSFRHTLEDTAALRKEARTASHRGAANDLRRHGLSIDGGRTRGGEEVRLLTAAGLAAAAIDLVMALLESGRSLLGGDPIPAQWISSRIRHRPHRASWPAERGLAWWGHLVLQQRGLHLGVRGSALLLREMADEVQ
ncbi:hypothetical protein [Streptomyces sp. CB02959]|uniref:hypothetical protein n=1 Tax=unclassified Streptomyces TaxID=2593676 RepID=UPI0021531E7F|nr:hypothetical protein [Streptomyces sp. CB02959]